MLKTITVTLLFTLFLNGCGFQLRGEVELAEGVEPVSVYSRNPYDSLSIALRNNLSSLGIQLAELPTSNEEETNPQTETLSLDDDQEQQIVKLASQTENTEGFQVHILSQSKSRRTLTLGPGARVAEYQLIETITFVLKDPFGEAISQPITLTERKTLPNDPNKIVSTAQEGKLLSQEMSHALAQKMARQISRFNFTEALEKTKAKKAKAAEKKAAQL